MVMGSYLRSLRLYFKTKALWEMWRLKKPSGISDGLKCLCIAWSVRPLVSDQTICFQYQMGSVSGSVIDESLDTWLIDVKLHFDVLIYDLNLLLVTSDDVRPDPIVV